MFAAIQDATTCTSVGGMYTQAMCSIKQQPACEAAGGVWHPRTMWSLRGGVDFLLVGLLQVWLQTRLASLVWLAAECMHCPRRYSVGSGT